jgi:hypothetical protein
LRLQAIVAKSLLACAVAAMAAAVVLGKDAAAGEASVPAVTQCEGARIAVHGGGRMDIALICAGGRDAIGFFAERKLDTAVDVDVEVASVLPDKVDPSAFGCYYPARKRVYVLPFVDFARRKEWFGIAIDPAMYRSLASHEIAHAIAACNFRFERPCLSAVEYIGYVAMLSSMPPDLRRRVLAQRPGDGFGAEEEINTFIYLVEPERFAVQSYRHYLRPENGDRFLRDVLAGRVSLE